MFFLIFCILSCNTKGATSNMNSEDEKFLKTTLKAEDFDKKTMTNFINYCNEENFNLEDIYEDLRGICWQKDTLSQGPNDFPSLSINSSGSYSSILNEVFGSFNKADLYSIKPKIDNIIEKLKGQVALTNRDLTKYLTPDPKFISGPHKLPSDLNNTLKLNELIEKNKKNDILLQFLEETSTLMKKYDNFEYSIILHKLLQFELLTNYKLYLKKFIKKYFIVPSSCEFLQYQRQIIHLTEILKINHEIIFCPNDATTNIFKIKPDLNDETKETVISVLHYMFEKCKLIEQEYNNYRIKICDKHENELTNNNNNNNNNNGNDEYYK